jgi:hypothetical protein
VDIENQYYNSKGRVLPQQHSFVVHSSSRMQAVINLVGALLRVT